MRPGHPSVRDRDEAQEERWLHPRVPVSWPVVVDDGRRFVRAETVDVSAFGAKLRMSDRLSVGNVVGLRFSPPEQTPLTLRAIVWRVDPNGAAVVFLGTHITDFQFLVPPSHADLGAALREDVHATREIILLVDADADVRTLARDVLEANGYIVLDAGDDPINAIRIAKDYPGPVDLLLTDVVMPLTNGLHLVERVAPLRPKMKIIFMSGYSVPSAPAGGAYFLAKPFSPDQLARRVRDVLDTRPVLSRPPKK